MSKDTFRTDEALLAALKDEDEKALTIVYKAHFPMVLHFISNNNGSEAEAKDIYQEAIMVLYENAQDEDFVLTCKIKTYLYSVARRLWLKKLAEKGKFVGRLDDFESFVSFEKEETEDMDEREMQFSLMHASLKKLGEPCRTILEDFFVNDLSMQEISEKMGYTNADNAKNQKYKCLIRLKKIFFSDYKS
ncbi:MAG: sigma-70 family RNA polymerase sigma factor [Verrucomicrobia bacterium]|nr:sigma-70 family RNA polymerase sigma factor [Cytophagales bacterium]